MHWDRKENQGKLIMKVEKVMSTNQNHLVPGKESELLEATTTANSGGMQQRLPSLCMQQWLGKEQKLKEGTSLLDGGVVNTAEK